MFNRTVKGYSVDLNGTTRILGQEGIKPLSVTNTIPIEEGVDLKVWVEIEAYPDGTRHETVQIFFIEEGQILPRFPRFEDPQYLCTVQTLDYTTSSYKHYHAYWAKV